MAATKSLSSPKISWWVTGDWNAFFGLFTNVIVNVLVLTGLALGVVKIPDTVVYGRILPALGIALLIGNVYYTYLAWRLAHKENRDDVCAMPYGPSVPHMFIVTLGIMLPIYLQTKNPIIAWQAGLAWCFIIGIIIYIGAFVGPTIRKYTPRAALLGTLAGISIAFISMRPAFQTWDIPWIGLVSLTLVLVGWTAGVQLPGNVPVGLAAVVVGAALGWATGVMHAPDVMASFSHFGFFAPIPSTDVVSGFSGIATLLVTAIPLGIYNFTEGMSNVESAAAAGDSYNLRAVLLADGTGAVVGSILGSPFPPAVYIGHPGWKAVGGRIGYSMVTGVCTAVLCLFGLVALLLAVIPQVALLPILLYIGLVIGAQAFQVSPSRYAPAIILALLPNLANWAQGQVDTALSTLNVQETPKVLAAISDNGSIVYHGMARFGGGAVLTGLILGAIACFVIDRNWRSATIYALAAAVLSFFGFIHGTQLAIAESPDISAGYILMAVIFAWYAWRESTSSDKEKAKTFGEAEPTPLAEG